MKTVAIMQPTYLPWAGYFDMIDRVDEFVYFDDVLVIKRSWGVRNRIRTAQGEQFLTVPLIKDLDRSHRRFENTRINYKMGWTDNHLETLRRAYAKTPFGSDIVELVAAVFATLPDTIGSLNIALIEQFCDYLGIATPRKRSSALSGITGKKAERLASVCAAVNASRYLSAQGSAAYIEADQPGGVFPDCNIDLVYHHFEHPTYDQPGQGFLGHMAIVDLIANCGGDRGLELIRGARRKEITSADMRLMLNN